MTQKQNRYIQKQKIAFGVLGLLLLSFIVLYMYLLSATVLHVVMRTELEQHSRIVRSDISELESQYILAQHKVSAEIASLQGYAEVSKKVFVDRAPTSLVLSSTGQ